MPNEFIQAARGEIISTLVLRNARVVNVFSHEIMDTDVAIYQDTIVGLGTNYHGEEEIDLNGFFLAPGFIDGHVHIESSMVEVSQFARAVVPLGTTSVVTDPHEIANVLGSEGIRYMMESCKFNPLNVFFMLPTCVPATPLETAGSRLNAIDLIPFIHEKWVLGLAEMMNYPGVLNSEPDLMDKIKIVNQKRIDGHAPGLTGNDLNAYIAAGVESDHECTSMNEAKEKLRLGMYIQMREGSGSKNLLDLLPLITPENERHCFFCTDDRSPKDILTEGHINYMIKLAIRSGLNPISAVRLATLNTAEYFGLRKLGSIGPGKKADLVVFDDFNQFNIRRVYKNGVLVAQDGIPIYKVATRPSVPQRNSVNIKHLKGDEFSIPVEGKICRVIEIIPHQIITNSLEMEPTIADGQIQSDPHRDLLRIYVIERHRASGNIGKGLVKGFGLKKGAIATSIGHDSHNIIAVGVSDIDLMKAVIAINEMGGGLVIVEDENVIVSLELPIAGLMSDKPLEYVSLHIKDLIDTAKSLGVSLADPFMTLSFLALPVIPRLKLTDRGLVDVEKFTHVELFIR